MEFVVLDRVPQVCLKCEPCDRACMHGSIEDRIVSKTRPLGLVHRDVGIPYEVFRLDKRIGCLDDSDAAGRKNTLPVQLNGGAQGFDDALGDLNRRGKIGRIFDQDRKFVTTDARQGVLRAYAPLEAPRNLLEQSIAFDMAQAVVDDLEPVEIQKQHGTGRNSANAPSTESSRKSVHEERAITQPCQAVVESGIQELSLDPLALEYLVGQCLVLGLRCTNAAA
jgi:hypothetical protein